MEFGPVQMLVVGFEHGKFEGEILAELKRLRDEDIIRLVDLLFVNKDDDGEIATVELTDLSPEESMEFGALAGALIGVGAGGEAGGRGGGGGRAGWGGGRAARWDVKRSTQAAFEPAPGRPDPVDVLERQAASRVTELVPIRYGRMLVSPFTFYRGAAAIMAADLAASPNSGLRVQLCGDAHLSNFGGFASPDRDLVFDINDFDETLPGPRDCDVKRL